MVRLLIFLFFISINSFGQKTIIRISDKYNFLQEVSYVDPDMKFILNFKPERKNLAFSTNRLCEIVLDIKKTTEFHFLDNDIIVEPQENIEIEILPRPGNKKDYFISVNSKYKGNFIWRKKVEANAIEINRIIANKELSLADTKVKLFKNLVSLQDSLEHFSSIYPLSKNAKIIFRRELVYYYLQSLCSKFYQTDVIASFDEEYFKEFNYSIFNDSLLLFTSQIYRRCLQTYFDDVTERFPKMLNYLSQPVFSKQLQKVKSFDNSLTRDYLYSQINYYYHVMKDDLNDNVDHLTFERNKIWDLLIDKDIKAAMLLLDDKKQPVAALFDYDKLRVIEIIDKKMKKTDLHSIIKMYAGKVIVLDIWASWCAPCINEFRYYPELISSVNDSNLIIIPLSIDIDKHKWLNKTKVIPELLGPGYCIADTGAVNYFREIFLISEIPRTIILNSGNEIANFKGASPSDGKQLEHQIRGLLYPGKKLPAMPPSPPSVPSLN